MKRLGLFSIIILVIVVIFIGNYTWNKKVETTVKKAEEVINNPTKKQTNDSSSANFSSSSKNEDAEAQVNDESGEEAGDSTVSTKNQDGSTKQNSTQSGSTNTSNSSESSSTEEDKPKSVDEIKAKYNALFTELEVQETSKVDQLVVEAKAEFVSNKLPKGDLIAKYQEVANLMEQNADRTFNIIYQQLEYDLEINGHSLNEAQEFRQTYNAKKQERLSRVVNQLKDF
ncbi:hypothetical protein ACFYKX_14040 [Cytobacillus sp. FJAT-54145]|uniref:Uncharacterized protein n=1 Tax=Cytobacillus spartinae TaxID=3299023 RepID=A0ABW6KBU5_9BACI